MCSSAVIPQTRCLHAKPSVRSSSSSMCVVFQPCSPRERGVSRRPRVRGVDICAFSGSEAELPVSAPSSHRQQRILLQHVQPPHLCVIRLSCGHRSPKTLWHVSQRSIGLCGVDVFPTEKRMFAQISILSMTKTKERRKVNLCKNSEAPASATTCVRAALHRLLLTGPALSAACAATHARSCQYTL